MDWLELIKSVEQKLTPEEMACFQNAIKNREELALQSARSNLLMSGYWIILFKDFNIGRVEVLEVFMCKEPAFKRFGEYCREDYPGLEYASEFEWLSRDGKKELSIIHKSVSNRDWFVVTGASG
jgi:hypothetical protein